MADKLFKRESTHEVVSNRKQHTCKDGIDSESNRISSESETEDEAEITQMVIASFERTNTFQFQGYRLTSANLIEKSFPRFEQYKRFMPEAYYGLHLKDLGISEPDDQIVWIAPVVLIEVNKIGNLVLQSESKENSNRKVPACLWLNGFYVDVETIMHQLNALSVDIELVQWDKIK